MRSVNKVILIGNLTRDPDVKQTPNGQQVCTFGIATNRQWVSKEGSKHSSAEFHELVAWARLAEICGQYLKKGKLIYIEGYLKTRAWDTPEGIRRHKTEIIVQDMIMLEKRPDGEGGDLGGDDLDAIAIPTESEVSEEVAEVEKEEKIEAVEKEKAEEPIPEPEEDKIEF